MTLVLSRGFIQNTPTNLYSFGLLKWHNDVFKTCLDTSGEQSELSEPKNEIREKDFNSTCFFFNETNILYHVLLV